MLRKTKRFGFNSTELGIIYKGYIVRPLLAWHINWGDVVWGSSLTCDQGLSLEKKCRKEHAK